MIDPSLPDFSSTPSSRGRPPFDYRPVFTGAAPLLSIVTNLDEPGVAALEDTAASLRSQSFQAWEWLLVGEGSQATSSNGVLARLTEADVRIRVVGRREGTWSAERSEAKGRFLLHLPSGDQLEPTACEKWLWFLDSHPRCSGVGSFRVVLGNGARAELLQSGSELARMTRRQLAAGNAADQAATLPEYLHWERGGHTPSGAGGSDPGQPRERSAPGLPELETIPFANPLVKEKRRLLMLVPWLTTGGADKFNLDLVSQLTQRGWEITIVTTLPGDNSWAPLFARLTPDVFVLERFLGAGDYPRFLRYLAASREPDAILISNSVFGYRALPYLRRLAREIPIVDFCHSVAAGWLDGGYPRLSVSQRTQLDLQVVSSRHVSEWMQARGADPEQIAVCYTNIDLRAERGRDRAGPSRLELAVPDELPIILYPCRVDHEKQPAVFAKTLRELKQRGHRFVAVVVGDGPYLDWLRRFVAKNGLDPMVRFLGRQPNTRVRELMALADLVFIPSEFEGISLAIFEAMAEGATVVGADVGGQRELVTPDCGVLVERGDEATEVRRYAEALSELLDDPGRRRALAEAARQRIHDHFELDRMGERMDALLEEARERARTRPRPLPTAAEARRAAIEAIREVDWARPEAVADLPLAARLRRRLFALAARVGMPVHALATRLGLHWVERLRERVVALLQPKPY